VAVFIQCTTDAFAAVRAAASTQQSPYDNVRRPLRGIQVKENTYATLRVKTASGEDIRLFDSSAQLEDVKDDIGKSRAYANFLIQSFQERRAEKQQIIQTFGEDYVYFFGQEPRFISVSGVLINTRDFNWKSEFWTNYDEVLRGTKLVEKNARLYFYFDDVVVEGYMTSAAATGESQNPHLMPFQFQIFITNYAILSRVGAVTFGASSSGQQAQTALEPVYPSAIAKSKALRDKIPAAGGLTGFLASASQYANDASFAIQSTLENIKNAFYGRALVVPAGLADEVGTVGLDGKVITPYVTNAGKYEAAKTGQPIYMMTDEYVEKGPTSLSGSALEAFTAEKRRINRLLGEQEPAALELRARQAFEKAGISTDTPSAMAAILGRGAFAGVQYVAPFALKKIGGGTIGIADQGTQALASVF
jgi:hypothetical protein